MRAFFFIVLRPIETHTLASALICRGFFILKINENNALKFGRTSNLFVYLCKQTNKTMTTLLQQFRAADQKVTEIQENGTMFNEATGQHETTCGDDFDAALELD